MKVAVLGAGGFIGGHLAKRLADEGHQVDAVDIAHPDDWHQRDHRWESRQLDVSDQWEAHQAVCGADEVYLLAADMGGMGFIETNKLACAMNVLITANVLRACADCGVPRLFYSSSACVYPAYRQARTEDYQRGRGLKESDAYPALPEDGYGWEKLYGERLCRHFAEETSVETRVARYHNIYGPHCAWRGGREKAPAALCRKVAEAVVDEDEFITIWGDGSQYRSYTYVDDCVEGTLRLMRSDYPNPVNIGSSEGVTVDQLVDIIEAHAGTDLNRGYDLSAPKGVAGRNSDNTLCQSVLGWAPSTPLRVGIGQLYRWVLGEVRSVATPDH